MEEEWFGISWNTALIISIKALTIYVTVILFTRISGKRSFSKMSSFDFATTVAIGSIIATIVLSSTVTLMDGIVGLGAIYILQIGTAILRRYEFIQNTVDNSPLLLMDGSKVLEDNLRKARVTKDDLRSKLREANVLSLDQVRAVVFETTGDISVLHTADASQELEKWIMENVDKK